MKTPLYSLWSLLRRRSGRAGSQPAAGRIDDSRAAAGLSSAGTQPIERCVSVVIPALNEAARIASVVGHARDDPATAEVIVIDDSSIDDTARPAAVAGAHATELTARPMLRVFFQELSHLEQPLAGLIAPGGRSWSRCASRTATASTSTR